MGFKCMQASVRQRATIEILECSRLYECLYESNSNVFNFYDAVFDSSGSASTAKLSALAGCPKENSRRDFREIHSQSQVLPL